MMRMSFCRKPKKFCQTSENLLRYYTYGMTHGIGIENEVIVAVEDGRRVSLLQTNTGKYPSIITMPWWIQKHIIESLNQIDGLPMLVESDWAGQPALEFITKNWRNRKLHQYVGDLLISKRVAEIALNLDIVPHMHARDIPRVVQSEKSPLLSKLKMLIAEHALILMNRGSDAVRALDVKTTAWDRGTKKNSEPRYTGSYHMNVTLPHTVATPDDEFVRMHVRAAMTLQWLEPLLASVVDSPSPLAPLSAGGDSALSMRLSDERLAMILGRNLAADSFPDDRHGLESLSALNFAVTPKYFRDMYLHYKEGLPLWMRMIASNRRGKTRAHEEILATRTETNELMTIGTDYRRDPKKGKRYGFEFRMMDNFPSHFLEDVLRLMIYAFDHSLNFDIDDNAFLSKGANQYVFDAITKGWTTKVNDDYACGLRRVFGVDVRKMTGPQALDTVSRHLYRLYKNDKGVYSKKMVTNSRYTLHPVIPPVNKYMWFEYFGRRFPDIAEVVRTKGYKKAAEMMSREQYVMDKDKLAEFAAEAHFHV